MYSGNPKTPKCLGMTVLDTGFGFSFFFLDTEFNQNKLHRFCLYDFDIVCHIHDYSMR